MKKLEPFGVAGRVYTNHSDAARDTYTDNTGYTVPTPLIFPDNPFNDDVATARTILDLGCGIGRNLPWIMENTSARYIGVDPNESMIKFFWTNHPVEYQNRVNLYTSFDQLPTETILDVVVCTFVFQHIGFRPSLNQMNVTDITREVRKFTNEHTVWILYEHELEERWVTRWMEENHIEPIVYRKQYNGIPELTHRGLHDLIIFQG